jgi:hypothetical protein
MDVYGHLFPTNTDRAELAKSSRLLLGPPPDANVVPCGAQLLGSRDIATL